MSLKEKLLALKQEELKAEKELAARVEASCLKRERKEKEEQAEVERLMMLVKERFSPIFEVVNNEYLGGRGKISIEGSRSYSAPQATFSLD